MSYSHATIKEALHDWVNGVTGRAVAFEHPNAPKRAGDIATMLIAVDDPVGRDARVYRDQIDPEEGEDVWETIQSHRTLSVSLNMMRGAVNDDMALLKASVSQDAWLQALHVAGLGFIDVSATRDLTELIHDSDWEARLQTDFRFATAFENEAELITITSVEITNSDTEEVISVPPA